MAITLPTQRSEVDKRYISQKFGTIGAPGIGKSEFWSFCNGLYIQTEQGLNHLKVMKQPCRSWDEFREIITALIQASQKDNFPYDTIIIDTIDKLVDLAQQETCERGREKFKNIDVVTVGDMPNGQGWSMSQDLVEMALSKLENLPAAIVYIGHLETKEVKEPTRSIHKQTISIGGKMGGMLTAWPDHLMNIQSTYVGNELKRVIRTIPNQALDAKSRGALIPDQFQLTTNAEENWKKFRSLFQ